MRLQLPSLVLPLLALLSISAAADDDTTLPLPNSITLRYEYTSGKPSTNPLATILYDPKSLKTSVTSWTPPSLPDVSLNPSTGADSTSPRLLRILLPNGSSTLTSLSTFNTSLIQTVSLHLSPISSSTNDGSATIYSASISATLPISPLLLQPPKSNAKPKPKPKSKSTTSTSAADAISNSHPNLNVKLIPSKPGPSPKLNTRKPPVIGTDGREVVPEEVQEKTLLQKYWWVLILVSVLALSSGGGGDK